MARTRMRPGTRFAKEMLATRIPTHIYDRTRAYAVSSRFTIEEITASALERYLDEVAPQTKAKFTPEVMPGPAGAIDLTQLPPEQIEQLRELLLGPQAHRKRSKG